MQTNTSINTFLNINSVTTSLTSDVRFNVIKRREFVIYETLSDNDNVNLAYVYNQPLISDKNISLFDRADDLSANKLPTKTDTIIFTGSATSLLVNNFVATNQFFTSISGTKIPLYYKHILTHFDSTNIHLFILDITVLDSNLN